MGKKRVTEKTEEEILKESKEVEDAFEKKAAVSAVKKRGIAKGLIFIHVTYNNTKITFADGQGDVIAWASAGSLGFKGTKKSTPFAASRVAEALVEKLQKTMPGEVSVFVKGIGSGRDSAIRALGNRGINITSIKDVTPIPHNGCRPPKVRRV